jgi:RNA polymerase sigma-70 factor, ECF subfamily
VIGAVDIDSDGRGATASLVGAARRGEESAWESLYRGLYPRLRAYLSRRVGFEHAEDAVNETMARAVAGIDRFELTQAGFDGWVFGIARRVAADQHRSAARRQRQGEAGQRVAAAMISVDSPDEPLMVSQDHEDIRACFSRLSQKDQELLELRVVAQLSIEQVANILEMRPGAVRTAQSRALSRLRRLMSVETSDVL